MTRNLPARSRMRVVALAALLASATAARAEPPALCGDAGDGAVQRMGTASPDPEKETFGYMCRSSPAAARDASRDPCRDGAIRRMGAADPDPDRETFGRVCGVESAGAGPRGEPSRGDLTGSLR